MAAVRPELALPIVRDVGLTVLRDPPNSIADIIFVHGLQGHPRRTWTCKVQSKPAVATSEGSLVPKNSLRKRFRALLSHRGSSTENKNPPIVSEVFWPLDLLPEDCGDARILTWGYESNISRFFAGPANQNTIFAHARDLLYALENTRRDCKTRSLIFVTHSLGGIIVKDVLCRAANEQDESLLHILKATKAVLFFGTPHRGSSRAEAGAILQNIAHISGFDTNSKNIQALQVNSPELEVVHERFMKLYQCHPRPFEVYTFQEAQGLTGVGILGLGEKVVGDVSSTFTGAERCQTINSNHMGMVRFSSRHDADYEKVASELKNLLSIEREGSKRMIGAGDSVYTSPTLSSVYSLNEFEMRCIRLLYTSDVAEYQSSLPPRGKGTCQWVLSHPQYLAWDSEKRNSLLWISGHPGTGKTTLSDYLLEHLGANTLSSRRHIVCGFFCDEKIGNQRDGKAILRSLIHQILTRRHKLIRHLKAAYAVQGSHLMDNFSDLWRIFTAITTDNRSGSMTIIIDAIDECEESTGAKLLSGIASIIQNFQSMAGSYGIKFVLTSRPLFHRRFPLAHIQIQNLDQGSSQDLRLVIQHKIEEISKRTNCSLETRAYLENTLYSKADRSFLWVALVLPLLEKTPLASQKDIQRIVENLPNGLTAIYEHFLHNIPNKYQDTAALLLYFISGSIRPLSLNEIRILLALRAPQQSICSIDADSQPNMHETLEIILGPMIRISEGRVSFVHLTAKDFLNRLYKEPDHPLSRMYGINQVNANLQIARSCISYLLLDNFNRDIFAEDQGGIQDAPDSPLYTSSAKGFDDIWDELDLGDTIFMRDHDIVESERCSFIARKYSFFDYAVHWAGHFASCGSICPEDLQLLALEVSQSHTNKFSNWFRYYWSQREADATLPIGFDPFIIACLFGHLTTVVFLQNTNVLIDVETAAYGLFWASYKGHSHVVSHLLLRHTLVNWETANHQTPLISAARFDHFEVVRALLETKEINVNIKGKDGRTALSMAAGNGHLSIVELLLSHQAIQPDVPDSSGWTPIFWAISGRYLGIVQRLYTSNGVNSNRTDKTGRSFFSWAAEAGGVDIVEFFLAQESIDVNQRDVMGMTAFAWAAKSGNIDIVSMMRRSRRVDIFSKNNDGRNAISLAASGGHRDVISYLLKHDPTGADIEDNDGWTPLLWTLDKDSPDTVQVLLSSGKVDPNHKDKSGRTALSWAAGYGYVDVTKRIVDTEGAKVDEQDNTGRTALEWAKYYDFTEVMEVLEGIHS